MRYHCTFIVVAKKDKRKQKKNWPYQVLTDRDTGQLKFSCSPVGMHNGPDILENSSSVS